MSQTDLNVANAAGATVRADINNHLEALATLSAGSTAPSVTFPNMWWFDTANNLVKQRDNANTAWITVAAKDASGWRPYFNGAQIDTLFAALAGATFTGNVTITSTDGGAAGPQFIIFHNTPSAEAGNTVASQFVNGNNDAGEATTFVRWRTILDDASDGSEDVTHELAIMDAGTLTKQIGFGKGIVLGSPTGGAKGVGSLNADALYVGGVAVEPGGSGTFTPTIIGEGTAGAGTYSTQSGRYTVTGNRCHFDIRIVWTGHTGTGAMRIAGLPFTVHASGTAAIAAWASSLTLPGNSYLVGRAMASTAQVKLYGQNVGGALAASDVSMDTAGEIILSGSYEVA